MKLELNIETVRCLAVDAPTDAGRDDAHAQMTHNCTHTCNHTTCEVC